jgi:hypothetical protein
MMLDVGQRPRGVCLYGVGARPGPGERGMYDTVSRRTVPVPNGSAVLVRTR